MRSFFSTFHGTGRLIVSAVLLGGNAFAGTPGGPKPASRNAATAPANLKSASADQPMLQSNPGPWGKIEYTYVYLEAPDNLLATVPVPNSTPHWFFPKATPESLRALFGRAGLPAEMVER